RPHARQRPRLRRGLGRREMDPPRGDRAGRARSDPRRRALRALLLAAGGVLLGEGHRRAAQPVRRPRGQGRMRDTATEVLEAPARVTETVAAGETEEKIRPPCTLVIFGASGDLTRRLLAPAIAHLSRDGAISPDFAIIGLARSPYSDRDFRTYLEKGAEEFTPPTQGRPGDLPATVQYIAGGFEDAALYEKLKAALDSIESRRRAHRNRIFYLATP